MDRVVRFLVTNDASVGKSVDAPFESDPLELGHAACALRRQGRPQEHNRIPIQSDSSEWAPSRHVTRGHDHGGHITSTTTF